VAVIATHFHWAREELLEMSRRERRVWIGEIERINKEVARTMKPRARTGARRK